MKTIVFGLLMLGLAGCASCAGGDTTGDAGQDGQDGQDGDGRVAVELQIRSVDIGTASWDLALSQDEKLLVSCDGRQISMLDPETIAIKKVFTKAELSLPDGYCQISVVGDSAFVFYGSASENMMLYKLDLAKLEFVWSKNLPLPSESGGLYNANSWYFSKKGFQGIVPTGEGNRALFILGFRKTYGSWSTWSGIELFYMDLLSGDITTEKKAEISDIESVSILGSFGSGKVFGNVYYRNIDGVLPDSHGFILDLNSGTYQKAPFYDAASATHIDESNGVILNTRGEWWVTKLENGEELHRFENPSGHGAMGDIVPVSGDRVLIVMSGTQAPSLVGMLGRDTGLGLGLAWIDDSAAISAVVNQARDRVWVGSMNMITVVEIPPVESGGGE